ncbi:MAG: acyl-CoA reductase [Gemmatimonadota bacterium]
MKPSEPDAVSGTVQDQHEAWTAAGRLLRAPRLNERDAAGVASAVRNAANEARSVRKYADVLRAVSEAAMRLADASDAVGREAERLLSAGLGWPATIARESLAGMSREWTEEALHSLVVAEIGDPTLLERFVPDPSRPGRQRTAAGPPLVLQIHAGNVPGVPVTSAVLALLARSGLLAKTGSDEPGLLPLFARSLADIDPLLGRCVAATWWPGEERPTALTRWGKEAGKAIVYGGDAAVQAVRESLPPDVELIVYGPRVGIAVFLPDAPSAAADMLARDVCAYEQRGCVSPRVVFALGQDALDLSDRIASGMEREVTRLGSPALSDAEAVALRSARAECEFAGLEDESTRVSGPEDLSWSVMAYRKAGIHSVALPRAVWVYAVPSLDALYEILRPFQGRIQSIGYAGNEQEEKLARMAARLETSRVCPVGEMAWPPIDWRHEGRYRLLPLLTWTDWEPAP